MGKSASARKLPGLEEMTGKIKLGLRNDFVAHYVFLRSQEALKGLVCSMMSLDPSEVTDVQVLNVINYGEYVDKEIILDIKVELNHREYIDLEIQVYLDENWEKRSLLYLSRTYNEGVGSGEDYSKLKPTTLITITDRNLGIKCEKRDPEFYARYGILNLKNHEKYSDLLAIKMLYLNNIGLATEDDIKEKRVYWAKMFKATTWEEIKELARSGEAFMEAAKELYNANIISEERTVMEAHQRYIDVRDGQKAYYERVIREKDSALAAKDATLAEKEAALAEKEAALAEKEAALAGKDTIISQLRKELKQLQ